MLSQLRAAIVLLLAFTVITGLIYPLAITGVAQLTMPAQANGSLISVGGKPVGSELIGQPFAAPRYFWTRPSATAPFPYNAAASSGSNLGPTNPDLVNAVSERANALRSADPGNSAPIPVDLVTASASGLDPHITLAGALYQAPRVARERGMSEDDVVALVRRAADDRQFGFFGEPRVNVLKLNLALDGLLNLPPSAPRGLPVDVWGLWHASTP